MASKNSNKPFLKCNIPLLLLFGNFIHTKVSSKSNIKVYFFDDGFVTYGSFELLFSILSLNEKADTNNSLLLLFISIILSKKNSLIAEFGSLDMLLNKTVKSDILSFLYSVNIIFI